MRKLRRFLGWSVLLVLCLVPLVVYGALPYVLAEIVKWQLTQQGFNNPDITLGYPDLHSLSIEHISLEKVTPTGVIELTIRKGLLTYQLSQLSKGQLSHIYIPDATVRVIPSSQSSDRDEAMALTTQSALTLNTLVQPLPPLPFEQLTIDSLLIVSQKTQSQFHEVVVAGALQSKKGMVRGTFSFQGPHTPKYELTIEGESLGNMEMALSLSGVPPTSVWSSRVQATVLDKIVKVEGSVTTDIQELFTFLSFIDPVRNEMNGASGRITVKWEGAGPKDRSLDRLRRDSGTELAGTFQVQGKVPTLMGRIQDLALNLDGTFTARPEQVDWSLSPQSSIAGLVDGNRLNLPTEILSILKAKNFPLVFTVPKGLQGVLRQKKSGWNFEIQDTGCVQVNPDKGTFSGQLCLRDWQGQSGPLQAQGAYELSGNMQKAQIKNVSFDRARWNVHGKVILDGTNVELSLDPASTLTVTSPSLPKVTIPSVTLNVQEDVVIQYGQESNLLSTSTGVVELEISQVAWNGSQVALQGATLAVKKFRKDASTWAAQGTVNIRGVSTTIGPQTPPTTDWTFDFALDPAEVFVKALGQTEGDSIVTKARLNHSWHTNRGVLQAKVLSITFSPGEFLLSQLLQPWPFPFDLASGKMSALAHIFWKTSSDPQAAPIILEPSEVVFAVRHLSGHFKKVIFQDLTTTITMRGAQQWMTANPVSVTLQLLHSGIDATNITGQVQAAIDPFSRAYRVQVKDFSSRLLGGTVESQEVVFDSTQPQQSVQLELHGVQIEELLQLEQQEGLRGTGLLDGVIPLTIGKTGVEVHEGQVNARTPGGVIQYTSADETIGSLSHLGPQMKLVVDALKNFKYHVLKAGVDYHQDGTLNLQMRLEGKNPDLTNGRPIHINFNLEENIPSLLKSLEVVRGIEKEIERMLKPPLRNSPGN